VEPNQPRIKLEMGAVCLGLKRPGLEPNLPLSDAEIKDAWSNTVQSSFSSIRGAKLAQGKLAFTLSRKVTAPGLPWIKQVIANQAAAGCISLFRLDVAVTFVQYCLSYLSEAHFNRQLV